MSAPSDTFRNTLAFVLIGAFISVIPLLVFKTLASANKEIITYMVGQLSGMATTALGFYFVSKAGQDALDTKRAETTGKMADAVVAATAAGSTGDAGKAADEVAGAAADKADEIKGATT